MQSHRPECQVGARTSASRAGLAAAGASVPGSRFLSTQPAFVEHLRGLGPVLPTVGDSPSLETETERPLAKSVAVGAA